MYEDQFWEEQYGIIAEIEDWLEIEQLKIDCLNRCFFGKNYKAYKQFIKK